mgnify:CR=1 FL=1
MASNSLKNMMDTVKGVLPRNEGNGWDVQKFLEMFHLIHDMRILEQVRIICFILFIYTPTIVYACVSLIIYLLLYVSYAGEKFHKPNAKLPAVTAQLQGQAEFQA